MPLRLRCSGAPPPALPSMTEQLSGSSSISPGRTAVCENGAGSCRPMGDLLMALDSAVRRLRPQRARAIG
eukprot:15435304-Alexandrium_andersonii.AAC.1